MTKSTQAKHTAKNKKISKNKPRSRKLISVFSLVMINVIAVDSIRALPISAEYGMSLIFYYVLGAVFFMIPSALAAAELSTGWPQTGGIYVWVKAAFGSGMAFLAAWLLWIYNIIWYPTILSLLASTFFYVFDPQLAVHKDAVFVFIFICYWLATIVNMFGMRGSSLVSSFCSIFGTLLPILLMIGLAVWWVSQGKPIAVNLKWGDIIPEVHSLNQLAILTGMLFGMVGMEMSAIHAQEVKDPSVDYPKALLISTVLILLTSILGSLAIALVIPVKQINLSSAVIESFAIFFNAYGLGWMIPVIAICIIIGGFGGVSAWIIGPSKCMLKSCNDGSLPKRFAKVNSYGVPVNILLLQGLVFSGVCALFVFFPGFNAAYWLLTAMTAQLALLFYILLFAALIKLRFSQPNVKRAYTIPGGKVGVVLVGGGGGLTCIFVFCVGLLSPPQIDIFSTTIYELILVSGILISCVLPFVIRFFIFKNKIFKK